MSERPIGTIAGTLVAGVLNGGLALFRWDSDRRARERAKQQAREDEKASLRQQQASFDMVAQQQARGHAGFASEAEARAA